MIASPIILALDGIPLEECVNLVSKVGSKVHAVKIHDLADTHGPVGAVAQLRDAGARRVWIDAKLHDIPNTVGLRAKAIANSGADILTVHAGGGIDMMMAAVEKGPAEIYAVTVLTSLSEEEAHLGSGQPSKAAVLARARDAKLAGVNGIVCSPKEVGMLSRRPELSGLKFITPGVRSAGAGANDQKRIATPGEAFASGATHIVVGREVTHAPDPEKALNLIIEKGIPSDIFALKE